MSRTMIANQTYDLIMIERQEWSVLKLARGANLYTFFHYYKL